MASSKDYLQFPKVPPASNFRLAHLAMQKLLDVMQTSMKRMDDFFANEICKVGLNPSYITVISTAVNTPGTRGSMSSGLEADVESTVSSHPGTPKRATKSPGSRGGRPKNIKPNGNPSINSYPSCPVDRHVLKQAANDMLSARNYILKTLKKDLRPFLMKHVIVRAVHDKCIQLVRLAIESNVEILDFRALEYWLHRSEVPQHLSLAPTRSSSTVDLMSSQASMSSGYMSPAYTASLEEISSSTSTACSYNFPSNFFTPPNEFDWFSGDKMGQILTMPEACELFSIIKMGNCTKHLQELYMNARRHTYFAAPPETLSVVHETLADFKNLTKLVLRGMCDDEMLKIVGQNILHLQHLDVSGSKFVTDTGIQRLFFKEQNKNTALYLISAWIIKNMHKLNPCTHSLTFLDYSWTRVGAMGRKMVQLLPGSYLFKRLMSSNVEYDSYGHHIFIRETPCMHDFIPGKMTTSECKIFEKHLTQHVGARGVKDFLKIVEHHPWKNCILNLYTLKNTNVLTNMTCAFGTIPCENVPVRTKHCYGIITPNQSEKRIQGVVYWKDTILTQLYTIYPININNLGLLNHLKLYRGTVTELWRSHSSLLPVLVHLDIFAEPATFVNIMQSCPNLRRLRVRIRKSNLHDDELADAIENCMCRRTLEDLWIASARPMEIDTLGDSKKPFNDISSDNLSNVGSMSSFSQNGSCRELRFISTPVQNSAPKLVQLSLESVGTLLRACPKLQRLGDLSTWAEIEEEQLYVYCEMLKRQNLDILILWGNMSLPNYCKKNC